MKEINNWTLKDFKKVSHRKWDEEINADYLIIMPAQINVLSVLFYYTLKFFNKILPHIFKNPEIYEIKGIHDSGYRLLDFVAVKDNKPLCRLSGCSDVIHFNGIGGYGYNWLEKFKKIPDKVDPIEWDIDCLPKSGLLRIFSRGHQIKVGSALSSFEIFAIKEKE